MANAGTHRLSMANTSDNNIKRRKNNAHNKIKYIHTKHHLPKIADQNDAFKIIFHFHHCHLFTMVSLTLHIQ